MSKNPDFQLWFAEANFERIAMCDGGLQFLIDMNEIILHTGLDVFLQAIFENDEQADKLRILHAERKNEIREQPAPKEKRFYGSHAITERAAEYGQ